MEGIHNNRVKLSAESTAALRGSERGDVYEHMLDAPLDDRIMASREKNGGRHESSSS